jgi:hypothetical protein
VKKAQVFAQPAQKTNPVERLNSFATLVLDYEGEPEGPQRDVYPLNDFVVRIGNAQNPTAIAAFRVEDPG